MGASLSKAADPQQGKANGMGRVALWINERTGLIDPLQAFLRYPVPGYVHKNLLYSLGGLTLVNLLIQMVSGVLLMVYYDPSAVSAYDSVDYIMYQAPLGWLVRGLHHYGASSMVILVVLHMIHTFSYSAYKKPREFNWVSGVLLLLITLGFGFTGYLLPWDQRGYWATKVGTEIAGSLPGLGTTLMGLMRGGGELGQLTLTRFYTTHVIVLPVLLLLFVGFHLALLRFHGMAPAVTKRAQARTHETVPFYPNWMLTDAILGLGLLALLIYLSWTAAAPLEFPADPTGGDYVPKPEWYFLFFYQLLKYFPGPLEPIATAVIPALIFGSMLLLPFLDTSSERRPWRKPITTGIALFYLVIIMGLTILAL